jgi:hypothetical protein
MGLELKNTRVISYFHESIPDLIKGLIKQQERLTPALERAISPWMHARHFKADARCNGYARAFRFDRDSSSVEPFSLS